ncbi:MAG: hypothetical protein WCI88_13570, partial [Chloroflexota bacterium]
MKIRILCLVLALALLTGFSPSPSPTIPLSAKNVNLIFVISPDLAFQTPGDVNPDTANLTNQGLQRSLLLAGYLKQQVLGGKNVNRIYTLEPMTHLQTAKKLPDMAAMGFIQQFSMLNQISLTALGGYGSPFITANSYPLNASYAPGFVPSGVVTPTLICPGCQGLDFNDTGGKNEALVAAILEINYPGYYVFSAPWETTSTLMANINKKLGSNLTVPETFQGSNYVYAISVASPKSASLVTYNSNLKPSSTYPVLPSPVASTKCIAQKPFSFSATDGMNNAKIPAGANTNETFYMVRHAEAHPVVGWDNGSFVAAGQWRALALPNFLRGKISPTEVYSIDPAQVTNATQIIAGNSNFSYVRPSLTVEPYAIANNLPFYLVSEFEILNPNSPKLTSDKFFSGGAFSNKTVLLAWEHEHFP